MINPSTTGWINKFFADQKPAEIDVVSPEIFYKNIRKTGLIYGHIISFDAIKSFETNSWTSEEFSKVALLDALFSIFKIFKSKKYSSRISHFNPLCKKQPKEVKTFIYHSSCVETDFCPK